MKNVLFIMMLGLMFGQTKLEKRLYNFGVDMVVGESILYV